VRLFFWRCPSAIIWTITKIIVNPIKRQILLVAVGKRPVLKNFKIFPLVAKPNTCATILVESRAFGIFAPLACPLPNLVKPTSAHVVLGKRLPASAWSAVLTLMGMICAPLKDFLTSKASELKVLSGSHKISEWLSVIHYNKDWGYIKP
jgi:hypothetical protein